MANPRKSNRLAADSTISVFINGKDACHMGARCVRKCKAGSHEIGVNGNTVERPFRWPAVPHPEYDEPCHEGACWPAG